jgi:fructose-1,6-bisphosphatase/inositol monophosphatase family enzyme
MGRYDAYYERGVKLWDTAAGALVCESVGLLVREIEGGIMVAPGALIDELAAIVTAGAGETGYSAATRVPRD